MRRFPLNTIYTYIVLSSVSDVKNSPFEENIIVLTQSVCPVRLLIRFPLDTLHTPIVFILRSKNNYYQFRENITILTWQE